MAPTGQAAQNSPAAKIDSLAQQMADRLKTHFKEDPIVRQALLDKYGDESHLPSAVDIKKQFYQAAKKHLTSKSGFLGRLFGEGTSPEQITALTFTLMNIADKTEAFLNMGEITKQLSLLGELEEQQKKMTVDLDKAKAVLAQQALFRARATKEHETQHKKVSELEAAQKQAGTPESEVLKSERQLLKDTEDRKKIFDAAFQLAQSKVDTLNTHIETSQKKAIMAMQYGMLGISREELQGLLDKNEINLELLHAKGILDKASDKKYEVLAEQDRTQQEGAVRSFLVEESPTPPKTMEAKR